MSTRRRKRRWRWKVFALVVVVVLGGALWVFTGDNGEGAPPPGEPGGAGVNGAQPDAAGDASAVEGPLSQPVNPTPVSRPEAEDRPLGGASADSPSAGGASGGASGGGGSVDPQADRTPPPPPGPERSEPRAVRLMKEGRRLVRSGEPVEGRERLNEALHRELSNADARAVRGEIAELNQTLIFSPEVIPGDPYTTVHVVRSGESLARIAPDYHITHRLLARINNIDDPSRIHVGQRLKVVKGPFHAVVNKRSFRLDVYLDPPGDAEDVAEDAPADRGTYVRSFDVGLGEYSSTPVGPFIVKEQSKLVNPEWTNPRTHQRILADDPENPLGERWIGLRGVGPETRSLTSYGIHGTIEPGTIGTDASMGCVRLLPDSIELLYAMLTESRSRVRVVAR